LRASGIGDRWQVIEGIFFESVPGGADAYLFRHVIHDWTDEQCIRILNNCRSVIPSNGTLLIVEAVVPTGNEPSLAKDFDMTMLTFPGGLERTAEEYKLLLEKAGFRLSSKSVKYLQRIVVTDEFDDLGKSGPLQNGWAWYAGI